MQERPPNSSGGGCKHADGVFTPYGDALANVPMVDIQSRTVPRGPVPGFKKIKHLAEEMYSDDNELQSRNKELYQDLLEAQADIQQQEKVIIDLQANLKVEVENSLKIKESANKMQYAMESKELFVGQQDSDDMIYSRYQKLIGQIKTWSIPFAQGRPQLQGELSAAAIDAVRRVAPTITDQGSFENFLRTPKNMRLFARGYVGFAIADQLFRNLPHSVPGSYSQFHGTDVWMDQRLVQPVAVLEETFLWADRSVITNRELHDWRVLTTTLVSRLDSTSKTGNGMESHVISCCEYIMRLVGQWVRNRDCRTMKEDLLLLLFNAVELSKILRCQRAQWSVRQVDNPSSSKDVILFDGETMEDKHSEEDSDGEDIPTPSGKRVEIIVSPGLFKRGNTDGEQFEYESCIERAEVKCG
ncbi:MAG: hypothetical protein Q9198_002978 [Flavoplaca austrocitrina]